MFFHRIAGTIVGTALITGALAVGIEPATAQQDPPVRIPPESLRVRLGEIVIAVRAVESAVTPYTTKHLSLAAIQRGQPTVVADFARLIPAAHVQTNSRGETLVYLRNAGERQVSVFFDGALLNVPWDNRIDLSLVPAAAIGGMTVAKGVPPIEYGANVLGGAVNLTSLMHEDPWSETDLIARIGTEGRREGIFAHRGTVGRFRYTGSVAYAVTDGVRLPGGAEVPFNQGAGPLRTNTDSRIANGFVGGQYEFNNGTRVAASVLFLDAEKGVAPESHVDPALSRVRFWRYPDWRNVVFITSGEGTAGSLAWKGAAWVNDFGQRIDSYDSADFTSLEATQRDDDLTAGARFTLLGDVGPGTAKLALNGLSSTHSQLELDVDSAGTPLAGQSMTPLDFHQYIATAGIEYSYPVTSALTVTAGASAETMIMPETGDKPDRDAFTDYSATLGGTYAAGRGWFVRAAVGRKVRFPTMRELFGEALNQFLLNPDLLPESSILTEVGVGIEGERVSGEIIPFGTFTSNTIDQRSVVVDPAEPPLRQRINLEGSRILGIEVAGTAALSDAVDLEAHLTLMDITRFRESPDEPTRISEKPEVIGRFSAAYHAVRGPTIRGEIVYTGVAYSPDDNNAFVELDPSVVLNVQVSQRVDVSSWQSVEVFVRGDNVTDTVVLPQLGLPAAGRSFSSGVKVTL